MYESINLFQVIPVLRQLLRGDVILPTGTKGKGCSYFLPMLWIRIRESGDFLTQGSGIGFYRIPDVGYGTGSRIPNPYF
jgi:hypothetical protein